jgi:hypothetical protein
MFLFNPLFHMFDPFLMLLFLLHMHHEEVGYNQSMHQRFFLFIFILVFFHGPRASFSANRTRVKCPAILRFNLFKDTVTSYCRAGRENTELDKE